MAALEVYDPVTDTWQTKAPMPKPRSAGGAAVVNGKLYTVGGYRYIQEGDVSVLEVYDPASDNWTIKTPMPSARRWPAVEAVNGLIYVIGGTRDDLTDFGTVEVYNPATDTWVTKTPMPTPRSAMASAVINGKIYVTGGTTNTLTMVANLEVYDPASDTWTTKEPIPQPCAYISGANLNNKFYAITGNLDGTFGSITTTVNVYDPISDTWVTASPIPTGRSRMGEMGVIEGKIYAAGGWSGSTDNLNVHEVFTAENNIWTNVSSPGGSIYNLVISTRSPNNAYAWNNGTLLRSMNGGLNWGNVNSTTFNQGVWTSLLSVSPVDPNMLFDAQLFGKVYKTNDGGVNGYLALNVNDYVCCTDDITGIAFDPLNPQTVYVAGCFSGIIKSEDGGNNWQAIDSLAGKCLVAIAVAPSDSNYIYAAAQTNILYRSIDRGASWSLISNDVPVSIDGLVVSPNDPNKLFAVSYNKIYKSTNGGIDWVLIDNNLPNTLLSKPVIYPFNDNIIYIGTGDYTNNNGQGVFKSINGGETWFPFNSGLTNLTVGTLAISPNGGSLLAGTDGGGIYLAHLSDQLIANAGSDQTVQVGSAVSLDGSLSSQALSYTWTVIGKPFLSSPILSDATSVAPTFIPDMEGEYTIKLVINSLRDSAEDRVVVRAFSNICLRGDQLRSYPVSSTLKSGELQTIYGLGGSGSYDWDILTNNSGGSIVSQQGSFIIYQAGSNQGVDIITMTDEWCGTLEKAIQVIDDPPETIEVAVSPDPTQDANEVTINANFSSAVTQAEYCVDNLTAAGTCIPMSISNGGLTATAIQSVGTLSPGTHKVYVRGKNAFEWGWTRWAKFIKTATKPIILLLNGYKFFGRGSHPEQWWKFLNPGIANQINDDFYTDNPSGSDKGECPEDSTGAYRGNICVVDNLDGKGPIDTTTIKVPTIYIPNPNGCPIPANYEDREFKGNYQLLEEYINKRKWIRDAGQVILIGHSYGGLISRAYASRNPQKVKAVLTIDTPHNGSGYLAETVFGVKVLAQACLDTYDDLAIPFFTNSGGQDFSRLYPVKDTLIYPIASERLRATEDVTILESACRLGGGLIDALPFVNTVTDKCLESTVLETGSDEVVPLASQYGMNVLSGSNIIYGKFNDFPFRRQRTALAKFNPFDFGSVFHNVILEERQLWDGLYLEKIKPILNSLLKSQSTTQAKADDSLTELRNVSLADTSNLPLSPAYQLQRIIRKQGTFNASSSGASVSFVAESGKDLTVELITQNSIPSLTLKGPGGTNYSASTVNGLDSVYKISQNGNGIIQSILLRNYTPGNWTIELLIPSSGGIMNLPPEGDIWKLSTAVRSPIEALASLSERGYLVGENPKVAAKVAQAGTVLTGLSLNAALVPKNGGAESSFPMFDDGTHDDGAADDGVYGGSLVLDTAGEFDVSVTGTGNSSLGAFQRQQVGSITVSISESTVSSPFTESSPDADDNGKYDSINWDFTVNVPRPGSYTVFGDLASDDGTIVANSVARIDATAGGDHPVTLIFPGREIYRHGKLGPYELKNLRITVSTSDGERMSGRPAQTAITGGPYWSWLSFEREETASFVWRAPVLQEVTRGGIYDLRWNILDGNGGTTLDLYYDTTGSGYAGTPIVTGMDAVYGEMSYAWDMSAMPDGQYYLYARVRNGEFSTAVYGGSITKITDTDGDGMPDAWESVHGLNPNSDTDAYLDTDGDLLTSLDEYLNNTDPQVADSDGGGENDGSEVFNDRDPMTAGDDAAGITLLGVGPGQGDSRGGDQVLVLGSGFVDGATVEFDAIDAQSVTFINSTRLVVTTPAHAVGLSAVTVTNPSGGGAATKADGFNFLYQFIDPPIAASNGPVCAGSTVNLFASTISGVTYSWTGPNGFASSLQSPVIPNATTAETGTYSVTVALPEYTFPAVTVDVTVNPVPADPVISAPAAVPGGASDLDASVVNHAGSTYNWTITNGQITGGQGTSQIKFSVGASGTTTLQVVEANATGCVSAMVSASVTICTYSVTPNSRNFTSSGGNGSATVNTASGCGWTATSNDGWITITQGGSGSGNGSFDFTIAANTGLGRTGTVTVGTETLTITQGAFGYEADVAPRPDGSGTVVVSDWVQVGRFSVGLDTPAPGSEFQRADCAPRSTLGDGQITVADWVQAGRYSVGLDPVTPAGGPTQAGMFAPARTGFSTIPRELRIATKRVEVKEGVIQVPIDLIVLGGESGLTFSLQFDPTVLEYAGVDVGSDVVPASDLLVNDLYINEGKLGVGIRLLRGEAFTLGEKRVLMIRFRARVGNVVETEIVIGAGPTPLGLAGRNGDELLLQPIKGQVNVDLNKMQ